MICDCFVKLRRNTQQVQELWKKAKEIMISLIDDEQQEEIKINLKNIVAKSVKTNPGNVCNLVTLVTKQLIYRCHCQNVNLSRKWLVLEMKQIQQIEFLMGKTKGKLINMKVNVKVICVTPAQRLEFM